MCSLVHSWPGLTALSVATIFEQRDFLVVSSDFHCCLGVFAAEADVSGGETGNRGLVGSSSGG